MCTIGPSGIEQPSNIGSRIDITAAIIAQIDDQSFEALVMDQIIQRFDTSSSVLDANLVMRR